MIKWLKMNNETKNHNPINLKKKISKLQKTMANSTVLPPSDPE